MEFKARGINLKTNGNVKVKELIQRVTVRSIVIILLVTGMFILAFLDPQFRPAFADLAKVGIGGYFGQIVPRRVPTTTNLNL